MRAIIDTALSRTRTVLLLFVMLLVAGSATYNAIPKEADPDIVIPLITISIVHIGISPEDAERLLLRPMEKELRNISGVKELASQASEGRAVLKVKFEAGIDNEVALADVRDRVSVAKSYLPPETKPPTIHQSSLASEVPAVVLMLSGPLSERGLLSTARQLKSQLEVLDEVLSVDIGGDRRDVLEIIVDSLKLESYGLALNDIYQLIERNNYLVTTGTMDSGSGRFAVKVPSLFKNVEDLFELPVKVDGNKVVALKDVAEIKRAYMDTTTFARINGQPSVALQIKKRPGENVIATVEKVKQLVKQARQSSLWPNTMSVTYTSDRSSSVKVMLNDLQNNVISAVLLVFIVVISILGGRTAILVSLSIPGAFLTGIIVIALFGMTINIVVLFALIMSVGMLVDGAIVVTEYADRCMSEGIEKAQAYKTASKRMTWPIIASTATTLAAFAPLIFWPGLMGEFMLYLPITLIAVLTGSLAMALLFVPTLGALWGKARISSGKTQEQIRLAEQGDIKTLEGFTGIYVRFLDKAIHHPVKILVLAFCLALSILSGFYFSNLGHEFFPDVDGGGINIEVKSQGDFSIYEKDKVMKAIESKLKNMPEIDTLYTLTGANGDLGYLRVKPVEWQYRRPLSNLVDDINKALEPIYGADISVKRDKVGPKGGGADLHLELSSRNIDVLKQETQRLKRFLNNDHAFINVQDNQNNSGIEWQLLIDHKDAARFGADTSLIGNTVSLLTSGVKIGEYRPDDVDYEVDIRVRFPEESRHLGKLDSLNVQTPYGLIPMNYFVDRKAINKVDNINKVNGKQVLSIKADIKSGMLLSQELTRLQQELDSFGLDSRIDMTFKGQNTQQDKSQAFLQLAFFVALFAMGVILVTQFNSFYQAFLILSAVLFSTVGVFLGLLTTQQPFGIVMCGIGIIALAGVVVNNNIVLIDTFNVLRKQNHDLFEAILRTGAQRLRPVLLTTVTTILGLMPMVLEMNIDLIGRQVTFGAPSSQWWTQLASAVAGGLAFATLLTLVLTPCLLALGGMVNKRVIKMSRLNAIKRLRSNEKYGA